MGHLQPLEHYFTLTQPPSCEGPETKKRRKLRELRELRRSPLCSRFAEPGSGWHPAFASARHLDKAGEMRVPYFGVLGSLFLRILLFRVLS